MSVGDGGGTFHWGVATLSMGGWYIRGWHIPGGSDFGPHLVDGWGVASMGGGKAKVLLLMKTLALQYYLAPFSKVAK